MKMYGSDPSRPCAHCTPETGRSPRCHGNCKREAAWLAERQPMLDAAYAAKAEDKLVDEFRGDMVYKTKRRQRRK